jgi:hypothetical protein
VFTRIAPEHVKGANYVVLLLRMTEGEQDPRNILVVFELWRWVLSEVTSIEELKYAVFELLDCYYPIEFNEQLD